MAPSKRPPSNGEVKISLPVRWITIIAIPLFGLGSLQVYSSNSQADVVERGILVHSQDRHRGTASQVDMQEVKFVQAAMGQDVAELKIISAELANSVRELVIELRIMNSGAR